MTGGETFDRSYPAESGSVTSREERISGRYGAGRPRGYGTRGYYDDSGRDEPRVAGSREDHSHHAGGTCRVHGSHRTTGAGDHEDRPDSSDDDDDSLTRREPASRRSTGGGARGHRVIRRDHHHGQSSDDDSSGGEAAGPRRAGTRTQGPSYSRGTAGSRYTDASPDKDSSDESTDDESANRARGGVRTRRRRRQFSPHPRRGMHSSRRSGSADSLDSEVDRRRY